MKANNLYISLRVKMLLIVAVRITIIFVVAYLWQYNFLTTMLTLALQPNATPGDIANALIQARANLLPLLGLAYLLLVASVWFITGNLTRSLRALEQATHRTGEGHYELLDLKPGRVSDEITRLTATFNQMIEKVRGREDALRRQVQKLTIQIDETQRRKDVSDVVASDFFQDLRQKAKEARGHLNPDETSE